MKSWFKTKELVGIAGLCKHSSNINRQARKEGWKYRKVKGVKGGGVEYALFSLPTEEQVEIQSRFAVAVASKTRTDLAAVRASLDVLALPEKQKQIADARMVLAMYVEELEQPKLNYLAVRQMML